MKKQVTLIVAPQFLAQLFGCQLTNPNPTVRYNAERKVISLPVVAEVPDGVLDGDEVEGVIGQVSAFVSGGIKPVKTNLIQPASTLDKLRL